MPTPHTPLAALLTLIGAMPAVADVRLPAIIGSNMALQAEADVPFWGWADPGETVTIQADWPGAEPAEATAGEDGRWRTTIRTPAPGGPYRVLVSGDNRLLLENVLLGEVWLASGQSNMEWPLARTDNAAAEIARADLDEIRLFTVPNNTAAEPLEDCNGRWVVCSQETARSFSAVAYHFGRRLHNELMVPVGLIAADWGGTPAQAWTSPEALADFPAHAEGLELLRLLREEPERLEAEYREALARWEAEGDDDAPRPERRAINQHTPGALFNGMIAPVHPYAIRGVIWYQGESNRGRAHEYRALFPAMISDWRARWESDFPFYFVQIAPYTYQGDEGQTAELREAQLMAMALPNTGMVVTMDIGDPSDIHPTNKRDVGERLARWALHHDYGRFDIVFSGPLYKGFTVEGSRAVVTFDHADGLHAAGGTPIGFEIAGNDRVWHEAEASIDGKTIVLSAPGVEEPVALRYAWDDDVETNLFNAAGLPASPFRTDDWPRIIQP